MEQNQENINKFSWRRACEFGMMYKTSIRTQLIIYAVIIVLVYLCMLLTRNLSSNMEVNLGFYTILSSVIAYLLYMGPLAFARRDDSLITQIPVKASEKFAFYLVYSLIIIPAFTEGIWYALNYGLGIFNQDANLECFARAFVASKYGFDITNSAVVLTVINTIIQSGAVILTVVYVVLSARIHRVLKGVLTPLGILFAVGVLSGIGGAVIALSGLANGTVTPDNETEFANHIIESIAPLSFVIDALMICYMVVMWYLTFRLLKKRQIS